MNRTAAALLLLTAVGQAHPAAGARNPAINRRAPLADRSAHKTQVRLPPAGFSLELIALRRGEWTFVDPFGQTIALPGPVQAWADLPAGAPPASLQYACADPERPEDHARAPRRPARRLPDADGAQRYVIEEPFFTAQVRIASSAGGLADCRLTDLRLGPALPGDRFLSALELIAAGRRFPLRLAAAPGASLRLTTNRIGDTFDASEPVCVILSALGPPAPLDGAVSLTCRDLARGDVVWRGALPLPVAGRAPALRRIPLRRFGVFQLTAASPRGSASIRLCRIPSRRAIAPAASTIGINLFQQQVWWYAHQAPLMARAGVRWIRPWLGWENTWMMQQPAPDSWDTRPLAAAVRRLDRMGMKYAAILFNAPKWMTGTDSWTAPPPDQTPAWERYVHRIVREFRGRIPCWEIWNEPDLMWPEATRHDGRHYAELLRAGYRAAKRADPTATILGLSHAGYEEWLDRVGALGVGRSMDVATMHTYARPDDFMAQVDRRRAILARRGMGDLPIWFNEFGAPACDLSPDYAAKYACTERRQAEILVENYAQALAIAPGAKAFWFCTLDPRDPYHPAGFTDDAGIGILYQGLTPKLAYAALAGVAARLDGRRPVGGAEPEPGVRVVAFAGPVAVAWAEPRAGLVDVPAARLGCAPREHIVVSDLLGNPVAAGQAASLRIDLSRGPVYVAGSAQIAARIRAERAADPGVEAIAVDPERPARLALPGAAGARFTVLPDPGLRIAARILPADGPRRQIELRALAGDGRSAGALRIALSLPAGALGLRSPLTLRRSVAVAVGPPNLIADGGFERRCADNWLSERAGPFAWDRAVGHAAPGALRLEAPLDRRMVYWNAPYQPGRPIRLRAWVRTAGLAGARITISAALFGEKEWLETLCFASTDPEHDVDPRWRVVQGCARIPVGSAEWTLLEAAVPASRLPADTRRIAFFVDAAGGGHGTIWLDDFDLWQPASELR